MDQIVEYLSAEWKKVRTEAEGHSKLASVVSSMTKKELAEVRKAMVVKDSPKIPMRKGEKEKVAVPLKLLSSTLKGFKQLLNLGKVPLDVARATRVAKDIREMEPIAKGLKYPGIFAGKSLIKYPPMMRNALEKGVAPSVTPGSIFKQMAGKRWGEILKAYREGASKSPYSLSGVGKGSWNVLKETHIPKAIAATGLAAGAYKGGKRLFRREEDNPYA